MDSKQTTGALNVAQSAVLEAGKIVTQSIDQLDRIKVTQKNRHELVTEIDLLAEQAIIEILEASYPDFNVLGEETGDKGRESDFCWVIDPLDGTHNFLHGHPHCCVAVALRHHAASGPEIILAAVYDALRNELFTARKGGGAQLDGRRIRVSDTSKLTDSLLCTGFPYRDPVDSKPWLKSFATVLPRVQSVHRTGSSILDLAYVACGRYDGFWEFGMREWDIAAGSILVSEAGGLVTDISGDTDLFKSGNLIAGTPRIYEKLSHLIHGSIG
ncbi:MAG: inositol monophosphatase [Arenicella sp.]|nr:inositol monophosphatase [Arenicella sp.]